MRCLTAGMPLFLLTISLGLVAQTADAGGCDCNHKKGDWRYEPSLHGHPYYRNIYGQYPQLHDYFAREHYYVDYRYVGEKSPDELEAEKKAAADADQKDGAADRKRDAERTTYEDFHPTHQDYFYYSPRKYGYPPYYRGPYYSGRPWGPPVSP